MSAPGPFVWGDEEGNYWGEGHLDGETFKAACLTLDAECGIDSEEEGAADIRPEDVVHIWCYQPDPEDEENWKRCDPSHPGAFPFTGWWR